MLTKKNVLFISLLLCTQLGINAKAEPSQNSATTGITPVMAIPAQAKYKGWLQFAHYDIESAKILWQEGLVATCLYHCQQATEKTLKGFLVSQGYKPQMTHDLVDLIKSCTKIDSSFDSVVADCKKLSPFATQTRYPTTRPLPDISYAQEMIELTQRTMNFILRKIEVQVMPYG